MCLQTVPGDLEVQKMITGNKKATSFWQEQHEITFKEMGGSLHALWKLLNQDFLSAVGKRAHSPFSLDGLSSS